MVALGRGASVGGLILFGTTTSLFAKIGESSGVTQGFAGITSSALFEHGAPRFGAYQQRILLYDATGVQERCSQPAGRPFLAGSLRPPSRRAARRDCVRARPLLGARVCCRSPLSTHHRHHPLIPPVYELESVGLDGKQKLFQKPWAMTLTMFVGESRSHAAGCRQLCNLCTHLGIAAVGCLHIRYHAAIMGHSCTHARCNTCPHNPTQPNPTFTPNQQPTRHPNPPPKGMTFCLPVAYYREYLEKKDRREKGLEEPLLVRFRAASARSPQSR